MPKIIKNGKEYSGVPIEVVTAWAPTADPVQVKEPLMGNTDISTIGDGTVTGAIDDVNTGLTTIAGNINSLRSFTVSIGYVANESLLDSLKRAINGGHIPFGVPFVACIIAGSYRFYSGFFYYSNNKTTGSCFASSFNSAAVLLALEDTWTTKAL